MTYSVVDYSDTQIKLTEDTREYIYKKVYCSCVADGDYVIFSTHQLETGLLQQQYKFLYTDCSAPSEASASALATAINTILNSYSGGGGGGESINTIMAQIYQDGDGLLLTTSEGNYECRNSGWFTTERDATGLEVAYPDNVVQGIADNATSSVVESKMVSVETAKALEALVQHLIETAE